MFRPHTCQNLKQPLSSFNCMDKATHTNQQHPGFVRPSAARTLLSCFPCTRLLGAPISHHVRCFVVCNAAGLCGRSLPQAEHLRRLIIDLEPPDASSDAGRLHDFAGSPATSEHAHLNPQQQLAVHRSWPPGTAAACHDSICDSCWCDWRCAVYETSL